LIFHHARQHFANIKPIHHRHLCAGDKIIDALDWQEARQVLALVAELITVMNINALFADGHQSIRTHTHMILFGNGAPP
jgi:hypothetical protein